MFLVFLFGHFKVLLWFGSWTIQISTIFMIRVLFFYQYNKNISAKVNCVLMTQASNSMAKLAATFYGFSFLWKLLDTFFLVQSQRHSHVFEADKNHVWQSSTWLIQHPPVVVWRTWCQGVFRNRGSPSLGAADSLLERLLRQCSSTPLCPQMAHNHHESRVLL